MFKNRRKGIVKRIMAAVLTIALIVSLCPGDMGYVMADEVITDAIITGVVTDDASQPLEGVGIVVTDGESNTAGSTTTIADGTFTVGNLNDELSYTITASKEGYKTTSQPVAFDGENNLILTEKADGSIAFDVTEASVAVSGTLTKTATATDGAGDATVYESGNTGVATVDNSGVVTPIATGTTTITATRPETEDYKKATASYTLTVTKGTQSALTWKNEIPTDLTWTDIFENTVTGGSGTGAVTYSSSDDYVAEVDANTGILTLKKPGTVTITATKSGGNFYEDVTAQYTLTINKAKQAPLVFADKSPNVIFVGDVYSNIATGGSTGGTITYSSLSTATATIDSNGNVTAKQEGNSIITATLTGNDYYENVSATYMITIKPATQKSDYAFQKGTAITMYVGDTIANPGINAGGTVTYSSNAPAIADVDLSGNITAKGTGTATITATDTSTSTQITCNVTVKEGNQTITFAKGNGTISCGGNYTNVATATTTVTYTSSDDTIATVDENGVVTGLKEGNVIITATATAENGYTSASAQYALHIDKSTQTVSFDSPAPDAVTFVANNEELYSNPANTDAGDSENNTVKYAVVSGSEYIKDFNETTGEFKIIGAGTITIEATYSGNDMYKNASATYTLTVEKASQIISFEKADYTANIGDEFEEPTLVTDEAPGSGDVTYDSSDKTVATVDEETGEITLLGKVGETTITVTKEADDNYNSATASYKLAVTQKTQNIVFANGTAATVIFNDNNNKYTNTATAGSGNTPTYSVVSGKATVDEITGEVNITGAGEIVIKATFEATTEYAEASATYTLTVKKASQSMNFTTDEFNLLIGQTLEEPILVTDDAPGSGEITYSSSDETVATVDEISGEVTLLGKVGGTTITATKTESESSNYNSANASYTINVQQWDAKDTMYTITDGKNTYAEGVWFKDKVYVKATNGYEVRINEEDEWAEEVLVLENDAKEQEITFYVKDVATGAVSSAVTKKINKDNTPPTASITYNELSPWKKILSFFGVEHNKEFVIKTEPEKETSGIVSIQYYIDYPITDTEKEIIIKKDKELDDIFKSNGIEYSDKITVDPEKIYVVYAKVEDKAGNYVYASTNGIVHDTTVPVIEFNVSTQGISNDAGGIYDKDIELTIKATDAAPYSGIKTLKWEVYCDDNTTPTQSGDVIAEELDNPSYDKLEEVIEEKITIDKDLNKGDKIVLKVSVEDFSGNTATKEETYVIDTTAPEIEMTYVDKNVPYQTISGKEYVTGDRKIQIVVTERTNNFNMVKATQGITIEATDASGNAVAIDTSTMISSWTTVEGATDEQDTHTATISFTKDATYKVSFEYANELGNKGKTPDSLSFVKDNVAPTLSFDVKSKGFGNIYKSSIDVDINVSDATISSGIQKIEYEVLCDGNTTKSDVIKPSDNVATYKESIVIDEELNQGDKIVLKAKVTDRCGKTYEKEEEYVINSSNPTLKVTYDNNETSNTVGEKGYFTDNRTATVVITERSNLFNEDKATAGIVIKAVDALGKEITLDSNMISEWTTVEGATDKQDTHTATISFTQDANYTVEIGYTNDLNQTAEVLKTNAVTPYLFAIDRVAPSIVIDYKDADSSPLVKEDKGYFKGARTATITITEDTSFDADDVIITVTAKDSKGKEVQDAAVISDFSKTASNTQMATINFKKDANYTFDIQYVDKARHTAEIKTVTTDSNGAQQNATTPYSFVVDIAAPTGKIQIKEGWSWDKFLETITFGLYNSNQAETVTIESADVTSGVKSVHYYRTTNAEIMDLDKVKTIDERSWLEYESFELEPNSKLIIYARIIDNAGHITYLSTGGIIIDDKAPVVEKAEPVVKVEAEQGTDKVYNGNVSVAVNVSEPIENQVFSGIKKIEYTVTSRGTQTQNGVLYQGNDDVSEFKENWTSSDNDSYIIVDANKNNSNSVVVKVTAYDYAGNIGEATLNLKIDISAPQISVSFDNNDGDASFGDTAYFKEARTATIVIKDNNFDPANVRISTAGATAVGWTSTAANDNGDDGVHRTSISFATDGDYSFGISCTDKAGNVSGGVDYGSSMSPTNFTIDSTAPEVTVTYDNNNAVNDNYYNAQRIATIQVKERNFELSRVNFVVTATDNGQNAELPSLSNWVSSGDIHTATVVYDKDALYTFDFDYQDKAGNVAADIPMETFYVDTTSPSVSISKIVDESANSDEGNIGFVITATDTNFDVFTPVLTAVVKEGEEFVTKQITSGAIANIGNGQTYTVRNVEADGIYRITCTAVDKAGNAYTEVSLEKADGSTYVEQRSGADTLVTFSVNRQGSVFELGEETTDIVKQYYVQNIYDDVVIVEVNTNALKEYKVTLNGKELVEGTDYTVTKEGGQGEWMKYIYSIDKSLFEAEGQYQVVVSSKDEADNDAFSDVKDATVTFVVDRTAPVVTVTGLETDGRYQVERQTVTIIPTDDGGALNSLLVRTVDEDGKELVRLVDLSGEELTNALDENDGKIFFDIEEGLYQNVQIICNDCATNSEGSTNTYDMTFYQVSVSSSAVKMLFASKGMRYGIIAGIILIVGGALLLIFRRKKSNK